MEVFLAQEPDLDIHTGKGATLLIPFLSGGCIHLVVAFVSHFVTIVLTLAVCLGHLGTVTAC